MRQLAPPSDINLKETFRLQEQVRLDLLKSLTERNELGQFATPPDLAAELADYVTRLWSNRTDKIRFLDPAIGTGSFFSALQRVGKPGWVETAMGIELDSSFVETATRLWQSTGLKIIEGDFTRLMPPAHEDRPNLILTNPPYVRHHHLSQMEKLRLKTLAKPIVERDVSGLTGLYCYFIFLAHNWLRENGLGVWLIPSEFMDVNYGRDLQHYLSTKVTLLRIHRFDPADVQFDDALVSSAVVVYQKAPPPNGHIVTFSFGGSLLKPEFEHRVPLARVVKTRKWSALVQPELRAAEPDPDVTLSSLFVIKRGIATGANNFFILPRDKAADLGIKQDFLKPILPSSRQLHDSIIRSDQDGHPMVEKQLVLIDSYLSELDLKLACSPLWSYLKHGEANGIRNLYLVSKRTPWYRQEHREPAPFLCTYMGRLGQNKNPFRFFWNQSRAIATNVYLLLYPVGPLKAELVRKPILLKKTLELLQAIEPRALVQEGRVYGGGLHKLEPSEFGRLDAKSFLDQLGVHIQPKLFT
jgi:adenine-specific DNA-methyltransferase